MHLDRESLKVVLPPSEVAKLNKTLYFTHFLTVRFNGGLGNNLFQYAALYSLAKANKMKPVISKLDKMLIDTFHITAEQTDVEAPGEYFPKYIEDKAAEFDVQTKFLDLRQDIELLGYFQSWKYFEPVKEELRKQFTFRRDILQEAGSFIKDSIEGRMPSVKGYNFVGVHIRRGDMISAEKRKLGYTVPNATYINEAMDYFRKKYPNIVFIVCSDDVDWSTRNVKQITIFGNKYSDVVFSHNNTKEVDLAILSSCNHTVMTVGTYGWWGAWLAGGDVVYYAGFPLKYTPLHDVFKSFDYYLPEWIGLE